MGDPVTPHSTYPEIGLLVVPGGDARVVGLAYSPWGIPSSGATEILFSFATL